jgi:hypothetical protein
MLSVHTFKICSNIYNIKVLYLRELKMYMHEYTMMSLHPPPETSNQQHSCNLSRTVGTVCLGEMFYNLKNLTKNDVFSGIAVFRTVLPP